VLPTLHTGLEYNTRTVCGSKTRCHKCRLANLASVVAEHQCSLDEVGKRIVLILSKHGREQ
jgi:hypothetical protein